MSRLENFKDAVAHAVKNPLKTLGALAVAGTAAFAAGEANAQTLMALEPDGSPESFVEWRGATSDGAIRYTIEKVGDKARRLMRVTTTPGNKVELKGACPGESSWPGWRVAATTEPAAGRDSAELDDTALERTGADGTWSLRMTASPRAKQTVRNHVDCEKMAVDENGAILEGDDAEVEDTEELTFIVTSEPYVTPSPTTRPSNLFAPRTSSDAGSGTGGSSGSNGRMLGLQVGVAGAAVTNLKGAPVTKPGVAVHASGSTGKKLNRWAARGRYSLGKVQEEADAAKGGTLEVDHGATVHCGTVDVAWNPEFVHKYVRGRLGVGGGFCYAEEFMTGVNSKIPGVNSPVAQFGAGLEFGISKHWGVGLGVDATVGSEADPANKWEGVLGLQASF